METTQGQGIGEALPPTISDARQRLVELLVCTPAPSEADVFAAGAEAGWRVPARLAVVAFRDERVARVAVRLPVDTVVARIGPVGWAIVPDPQGPGRRAVLLRGLEGIRAGIGPAVAPSEAAMSARLAAAALELTGAGAGPVLADERRVDLMLAAQPAVTAWLTETVLAPLDVLPAAAAQRLVETLAAWLAHQGEVRPAAAQLHVHTQTVRYRVAQLRELLGDRMGSPEGRLELELALRARRLAAPGPAPPAVLSR